MASRENNTRLGDYPLSRRTMLKAAGTIALTGTAFTGTAAADTEKGRTNAAAKSERKAGGQGNGWANTPDKGRPETGNGGGGPGTNPGQ